MRHLTYDEWIEIMDGDYDPLNSTQNDYLPSFMEKTETEQTRREHDIDTSSYNDISDLSDDEQCEVHE